MIDWVVCGHFKEEETSALRGPLMILKIDWAWLKSETPNTCSGNSAMPRNAFINCIRSQSFFSRAMVKWIKALHLSNKRSRAFASCRRPFFFSPSTSLHFIAPHSHHLFLDPLNGIPTQSWLGLWNGGSGPINIVNFSSHTQE